MYQNSMLNVHFYYQGTFYSYKGYAMETPGRPCEAYVCNLCRHARHDPKLAIRAATRDGAPVQLLACVECVGNAYVHHHGLTGPIPKAAIVNAVLAEMDPAIAREAS
jgi:hypothetical protein